jgi:O-antigen ligase
MHVYQNQTTGNGASHQPSGMEIPLKWAMISKHQWITFVLAVVGVYLIFAPVWAPSLTTLRYDNTRFLQIGLLLSLMLVLILPGGAQTIVATWRSLSGLPRVLAAVFLIGSAASTLASAAPQLGALETGLVTLLVYLFLCVMAGVRILGRKADTLLSLATFLGVGILVLQFWVFLSLYMFEGKTFPWISPFLEFANVRFFSQYQAYTLFLLTLPLVVYRASIGWKVLVYTVAANFWCLQWMVGGRAVWAGLIVAALAVLLFGRPGKSRWLLEQGLLMLAGAAIFLAFTAATSSEPAATPIPTHLSVVDRGWQSVNERVIMAVGAAELVKSNPVLGVGPAQFGLHYSLTRAAHPHNSVLEWLSEYGLVSGVAGVMLLGTLALFAIRTLRREQTSQHSSIVNIGLGAALVSGLVDSFFSGNLLMPHSQMLLAVLAGWLVGRNLPLHCAAVATQLRYRAEALAALSCITLAGGVLLIFSLEYLVLMREMPFWFSDRIPHFWQYGRFYDW